MAANFRVKIGKIGLFTHIRNRGILILYVNLVNFGPVTLEFKIGKDVHTVDRFFL